MYSILVGKTEGKALLGRHRCSPGCLIMGANLAATFLKFLVLSGAMSFAIEPSDALIIHPPHDGRTEIKHCCNDNGETSEFVV